MLFRAPHLAVTGAKILGSRHEVEDEKIILAAEPARHRVDLREELHVALAVAEQKARSPRHGVRAETEQGLGVVCDDVVVSDEQVLRVIDMDAEIGRASCRERVWKYV